MTKSAYYILATEALGSRQWFSGIMPSDSGMGYLTCLCSVIFDAYDFDTREAAEKCIEECGLKGFEIVACEIQVSAALAKGLTGKKGRRK